MTRGPGHPEQEAEQLLHSAREEFAILGEAWENYRIDVELIGSILFGLGVQRVQDLAVGDRAYAGFLDAADRLIAVEESHHEHRQRFSIAHEIGHFVLHYLPQQKQNGLFVCSTDDMDLSTAGSGESSQRLHTLREWEANRFASVLLMPEPAVRAMHRVTGGRVARLAMHFNVSPQAMTIRLRALGLSHR